MNVYFGTTSEPPATLRPSWHVERDLTDLALASTPPQAGHAILGNIVGESGGVDYTGVSPPAPSSISTRRTSATAPRG